MGYYLHFKVKTPPSLRSNEVIDAIDRGDIARQCRGAKLHKKTEYHITILFHGRWHTEDGSPAIRDVHNLPSKLADVLAKCLGINDCQFTKWEFETVEDEAHDFADVTIRERRWRRCA